MQTRINYATLAARKEARNLHKGSTELWVAMDASGVWWVFFQEPSCWVTSGCWADESLDNEMLVNVPAVQIDWRLTKAPA